MTFSYCIIEGTKQRFNLTFSVLKSISLNDILSLLSYSIDSQLWNVWLEQERRYFRTETEHMINVRNSFLIGLLWRVKLYSADVMWINVAEKVTFPVLTLLFFALMYHDLSTKMLNLPADYLSLQNSIHCELWMSDRGGCSIMSPSLLALLDT